MTDLFKILSVFLTCMVFYGKLGVPAAIVLFNYDLLVVCAITIPAGILGNFVFVNMMQSILKWIHNYRVMKGLVHRKRIFSRFNRRVIKVKQKFGLGGIAFVTPMFLSTPLGAFIAEKFYKDKKKVILYFSISIVFWTFALYFLLLIFQDFFRGWLI